MDFGQQRLQQQDAARQMMYQNSGYQFERRDKKTLIVDVADNGLTTNPLSTAGEFSVDLFEPLIVDKLSDVYLDNFTTYNSLLCDKNDRNSFSLQINEFNVNSNVASSGGGQNMFNRILIPNEHNDVSQAHSSVIHKGKKMNYVCSINPGKLSTITGKISDLAGNSMFSTSTNNIASPLYSIKVTTDFTTEIRNGTKFKFTGTGASTGTDEFITGIYNKTGTNDLYFYKNKSTSIISSIHISGLNPNSIDSTLGGISAPNVVIDNSFRIGDLPRFTAEFVIVARD